jgi:hypothetical protein
MDMKYRVEVQAEGEVRDAEGNLLSTEPVTAVMELTAEELRQMNLPVPEEN